MKTRKSKKKKIFTKTKNYLRHKTDINRILVSKKDSYGTKKSHRYFIGYGDDDVIRPVGIKLPQMIGYVKCFDSNKECLLR